MSKDFEKKLGVVDLESEKDKKTIYRVCKNKDNPYTILNKSFFEDNRISLKAKGLLGYLLTKPDDWIVYRSEILKHCTDKIESLKSAIKELKQAGYLKISPERDKHGRVISWSTHVFETPQQSLVSVPKNPEAGKPVSGFPTCGKSATTNNNDLLNNKNNNNRASNLNKLKPTPIQFAIEPDGSVVVSLMERIKHLPISKVLVTSWLKKYGVAYVEEKIQLTENQKPKTPERFLNKAISEDWKPALPHQPESKQGNSKEPVYPSHEENIAWYHSLSEQEKLKYLKMACSTHYTFEGHLKFHKISVLDATFFSHSLFKMFMSLLGRGK